MAGAFGLSFNNSYPGLADGFAAESIRAGLKARAEILGCNSTAVIAMEIRYRDAPNDYLPPDSPWWKRDVQGNRLIGWAEGGHYLLDFSNPDFQKQLALQCLAAIRSGVVDGCFFDWWSTENPDRLSLIRRVRATVGADALIIVNANESRPVQSAPYINGIYMEGFGSSFFSGWQTVARNLLWARSALLKPAITAFEGWYPDPKTGPARLGRNDLKLMRMLTTLSLVFSDGSVLFGDPNALPLPDHLHDWYPFWDRSMGKPIGDVGVKRDDGSYWRQFENGTVVFNPPENASAIIEFPEDMTSRATRARARRHVISPGDGDIFQVRD